MAAVCHLGCLKEVFHTLGTPFSTYTSNLVKTSWSVAEIRTQNRIRNNPLPGGEILLPVFVRGLPMCDHTKFQPNDTQVDDCSHCRTDKACLMHHFCLSGRSANPETPKMAEPTSDRESDGRFRIGKAGFLFEFPSNNTSISLSFEDIRVWQTDGQTDNADHYYSWPPHYGWSANKNREAWN